MEKLIYWLKKLGVIRTSSYKVKGDASKLNEMTATDGGMIQSQKKIDADYSKKSKVPEKTLQKDEKKKSGVLFWIFLVLAIIFLLAFLGGGFSFGSFLAIIFWIIFLYYLKRGVVSWSTSIAKIIIIGLVITIFSLVVVNGPDDKESSDSSKENSSVEQTASESDPAKCDDSNSTFKSFYEIEKTIVSINPCEVPWILAREVPDGKYELKTKKGTTLKATVFNHYKTNVDPDDCYFIRVLDVEEDITGQKDVGAGISIVRWIPNKKSIPAAKKEIAEIVSELDY